MRIKLIELTGGNKNKISQIFKKFDKSEDNYINLDEFNKMLEELGISCNKKESK